tara:strand:- start:474 stop:983 length:510 start_codon:yes stop_codon:yes gene_type:complete
MVGLSIMGAAAPGVMQMSIAPLEAQKRAQNFGIAESAAVVYAAQHEGTATSPVAAGDCEPTLLTVGAWQVTCSYGADNYRQSVTRGFRVLTQPSGNNDNTFSVDAPASFSIWQCPPDDPFGVEGFNDRTNGWCVPTPLTHWGKQFPIEPENWVYDLSPWFTGSATGPQG